MRRVLMLVMVLLAAGCAQRETSTTETAEADFRAEREQYRTDARARLDRLDARIDSLKAVRDQVAEEARREEINATITTLEARRDTIRVRLDEVGDDTADAWNATRSQVEEWMRDLEQSVEDAWTRVTN